ncbi:hypothetical protein HOY34_06815 [Xinfangfangia sp. D13-10-4-6]|uniref:hypothetical protein n=1 Tax=Pseudogemmobacter hezensis TaxID=2737662 RepID=UPI001556ECF4|nr:hypothetical protein [Pseudogemmobacter hezensis]NPD14919.1 hypothetical protein [Pseudogemmobacter hezensis]
MAEQQNKQPLSDAELETVVGGASVSAGASTQVLLAANFGDMDLEAALLAVQEQRAGLLNAQLQNQLTEVRNLNKQIETLNNGLGALGALNAALDQLPADGALSLADAKEAISALEGVLGEGQALDSDQDGLITKDEVDSLIVSVRATIDSLSNAQQMDMLRLQELNSKRNQAFEMMTAFIQKMQDSRASIIGNMR